MSETEDGENTDPNARRGAAVDGGWDAKPVSTLLQGLEAELRHAEGELCDAIDRKRLVASGAPMIC
jgi:hypothetical protein